MAWRWRRLISLLILVIGSLILWVAIFRLILSHLPQLQISAPWFLRSGMVEFLQNASSSYRLILMHGQGCTDPPPRGTEVQHFRTPAGMPKSRSVQKRSWFRRCTHKSQGFRDALAKPTGVFLFRYEPNAVVRRARSDNTQRGLGRSFADHLSLRSQRRQNPTS